MDDALDDDIELSNHLLIGDAQYRPAELREHALPPRIEQDPLGVVLAIDLDDEPHLSAREIDDEVGDDELPPKRKAGLGSREPAPDPSGHIGYGDGPSSDRLIGSPQSWSDPAFQSGQVEGAAVGAYVAAHFVPALNVPVFILDGALFVKSEKDIPLLLLGRPSFGGEALSCPIGAGEGGGARGLGDVGKLGGSFSSTSNAAGGKIITSVGEITQADFASLVVEAQQKGDTVYLLTGVHGYADGTFAASASLLEEDVARFAGEGGVHVLDVSKMSDAQIGGVLEGSQTVIGAFCHSGICLAPFR